MLKYLKKVVMLFAFRPTELKKLGKESFIRRPFKLDNRKRITIGENVFIHRGSEIMPLDNIEAVEVCIGDNVYIGQSFHAHTQSQLIIGKNSVISDNVYISGASMVLTLKGGIL